MQAMKELNDVICKMGSLLGLLKTLREAAYNSNDDSEQMACMANSLELAAGLLEKYYERIDEIETDLGKCIVNLEHGK